MKYRRFGRTEITMPVITCGGMRYQHSWSDKDEGAITPENQENLERTIHSALERGINHIETARGYGTSEVQLGRVLPALPREKIIVQTKVAPAETQPEFFERFEKSMKNLRLDYVDFLGIHGINNQETLDWTLRKGGSLEAARKLQKEGRVRFIGFSTHGPLEVILRAIGSGEFDYVNLHWYYIFQLNWPAIMAATAQDMGVFIISPNDKGGKLYAPSEKLRNLCEPLSPIIFNDLFCLLRPEVHTLSIGAARPSDFDEHLRAVELMDRAEELVPPIEKRLTQEIERIIGPLWPFEWSKGMPEWTDSPGGINVREVVRLWTMFKAFELHDFAKERYNLFGQGGHWFSGCRVKDLDDAQIAASGGTSQLRQRVPEILREMHTLFDDKPKERLSKGG
ncbi:MAG: aldo/keto reductase [Armatimonadetes bacterium]|nr:aldo/keto reductase [Armatimonadota bacterium]